MFFGLPGKAGLQYRRMAAAISVAACVAVLASCTSSTQTHQANQKSSAQCPARGGTITIAQAETATSLDVDSFDQQTLNEEAEYFYEGLFARINGNKVVPWLAKSQTVSPNGKVVTWQLRPHVKFHDGTPFNAAAVVWNLERKIHEKLQYANFLPISSITATGPMTVVMKLTRPFPSLDDYLAIGTFSMYSPTYVKKHGEKAMKDHEAGTGPFELASYNPGTDLKLKRFPGYWKQGLPCLDGVTFQNVPDEQTRVTELESRQVNIALGLNFPDIKKLSTTPGVKLLVGHGSLQYYGAINTLNPELDLNVRKAMNYALDKQAIAKDIFLGYAQPAHSILITPSLAGYADAGSYTYDQAKAKQILSADGWNPGPNGVREKDGKPLDINILSTNGVIPGDYALAQLVQAQLDNVGFHARITIADAATWLTQLNSGAKPNYDVLIIAQTATANDPAYYFQSVYLGSAHPPNGFNYSWFADPTTDKLIEQTKTVSNPTKLQQLYTEIQKRYMEEAPVLLMNNVYSVAAMTSNVHGVYYEPGQAIFPAKFGWLSS